MLIPLTRKKFEELAPLAATGEQYRYYWGKPSDILRRLLISVTGVVGVAFVRFLIGEGFDILLFIPGFGVGFYWLWSPVYWATRRNMALRKYRYSGFWRGKVADMFITEDLIGTEETVNKQGELVIVENRERRLNLEVEDETGFYTKLQVPLNRDHRVIRPGDIAEMVVLSNRADLSRIAKVSDVFLPECDLWVSDYPYLRRDAFAEVSRRIDRRRRSNDR
ncbi:MAG: phosphate ABC transporter permease [Cyanobacteria bacterium CRU_2_1]|nr:phosphate ABC transporter permease [Cyanobacteria bacterium RU_5_0]NJR61086.1 phosphate ABC transporter permease [Cyanobacteria bacterium CRU_2_1]